MFHTGTTLCLREYLSELELASRISHAWAALSNACHHHPYQLSPNSRELRDWLEVVKEATVCLASGTGSEAVPNEPRRVGI